MKDCFNALLGHYATLPNCVIKWKVEISGSVQFTLTGFTATRPELMLDVLQAFPRRGSFGIWVWLKKRHQMKSREG